MNDKIREVVAELRLFNHKRAADLLEELAAEVEELRPHPDEVIPAEAYRRAQADMERKWTTR